MREDDPGNAGSIRYVCADSTFNRYNRAIAHSLDVTEPRRVPSLSMSTTHFDDADLFASLHHVIEDALRENRRATVRHDYRCRQLVAPYQDGEMPEQSEFELMTCKDLSARGFSYTAAEQPPAKKLIVALGRAPFTFAVADVVRLTAITQPGKHNFLVSCQFSARVFST